MYIAMNRFRVVRGAEAEFEAVWSGRETRLRAVPGFLRFALLRGEAAADHTPYASHSEWRDPTAFRDWLRSDSFRRTHAEVGRHRALYLGPPQFEGFEVVLAE